MTDQSEHPNSNNESSVSGVMLRRYSCRTYRREPVAPDLLRRMSEFLRSMEPGPFRSTTRFLSVGTTPEDADILKGLGTYGFIKNPAGFLIGSVGEGARNLEDFGYQMESAVLFATQLGLGTCWLGGTFSKSKFERLIKISPKETLPAVVSFGYPAEGTPIRERMHGWMDNRRRLPWAGLFFNQKFKSPLDEESAGEYRQPLEMVRIAPSASNRQPWRVVRQAQRLHFYLCRTKGYGQGSMTFALMGLADLQRVDMGIAMCHFSLAAQEAGRKGRWVLSRPDIDPVGFNMEYCATWEAGEEA